MIRAALICALGLIFLAPDAAAGGGWWSSIHVDRSHVAPGERVELDETVAFRSAAAADAAQRTDRFHVYLLRGFDYAIVERAMRKASPVNWWSLGDAEAIEVGRVSVSVSDAIFARATAAFTVPELPPATYHLMLCDTGCTEPLADVIPAPGFVVVADPATVRMAKRLERLERRSRNHRRQLAAARAVADGALLAARTARSELRQLEASVSSLPNEGRSSPAATRWADAGWPVAAARAAALAVLVLRRAAPLRARHPR